MCGTRKDRCHSPSLRPADGGNCSCEQIRKCHGDAGDHCCEKKEEKQ